jgi:hypothetical protein
MNTPKSIGPAGAEHGILSQSGEARRIGVRSDALRELIVIKTQRFLLRIRMFFAVGKLSTALR